MRDTLKPKAKAVGLGSRVPTGPKIDPLLCKTEKVSLRLSV
jgi:hypothetical protein